MKRIIFAVMLMAAIGAAATDRFYIENFTIAPGETTTVSMMLDNETAYTAFQTDIYMPSGLTINQVDGDYIFDLTTRKSGDHIIASQLQPNGSIRMMSYSPRINAYSGNSGVLVTFSVTAAADFSGPATIFLKGTLFTTTAGTEISFIDEQCTVTLPVTSVQGDVNNDNLINISDVIALITVLSTNDASGINLVNADVNGDNMVNITDTTMLITYLSTGIWP